jgi:hypothetical protein
MKRIFLFICLCVLLFAGCRTPKKFASDIVENIKTSEQSNEVTTTETYSFVDTTKKSGVEISYYKIEFYPPAGPVEPDTIPDNSILPEGLNNNVAGSNTKTKPPNIAGKGVIKSIEGYTVKNTSEQTGINVEKGRTEMSKTEQNDTDVTKMEKVIEEPAADPYRWRYIFGIIVSIIVTGVCAYFVLQKKSFITTILSFVKKIF